ncbi:MAG: ribosome biogenesis GTPase Der [Clostridia bacterium]|nr:ribosome biogenesis GTPase Der [Clostridia bacterium]MBQ2731186.1 ribosome biogenesis GTPase Der [Clostridia bacterium]
MALPVVAVVGRPNVGKSTFFNKLVGERISIVEDVPGVTRDRIYSVCEWAGRKMLLVDTGGLEPNSEDEFHLHIKEQVEIAVETADVIIMMTEIVSGLMPTDREIARFLSRCKKPVVLAVNKVDSIGHLPPEFYEFYELGIEHGPFAVSSVHGTGSGDILECVNSLLPPPCEEEESERIRVAVIGKPNSGKSSLVNRITGQSRMIVSNVPGTTRDAVDTEVDNEYGSFTFIDTAGIRRQSKVEDKIEKYSVLRAKLAVERADVCILMVDSLEMVTQQDERIAGIAHESGKPTIVALNKWDLVDKDNDSVKKAKKDVEIALSYMTYAPLAFISAKTGQRVTKLFDLIRTVYESSRRRIPTGVLNDVLADAVARVQPPSDRGRRLKIYYMTQVSVAPPTFVVFCNSAELFHFSYRRYLENNLRETFDFEGTPIRIIVRERGEEEK